MAEKAKHRAARWRRAWCWDEAAAQCKIADEWHLRASYMRFDKRKVAR